MKSSKHHIKGFRDRLISSRVWKISKKIWIIISSTIMIILLSFLAYAAIGNVKYIDNQFGESVKEYSSFWTDKCLINTKTGKKIVKELDWIVNVYDGDSIAVFSSKGKRGYVNINTGQLITLPCFDRAWAFRDGIAAVMINERVMFIKPDGNFAFPEMFLPYEDDVMFRGGYCVIRNSEGKCGLIDTKGKWIVPAEYDGIGHLPGDSWFNAYKDCQRTDFCIYEDSMLKHPASYTISGDTIFVFRDSLETFIRVAQ